MRDWDWHVILYQNEQTVQPDVFKRDACETILSLQKEREALLEALDDATMDAMDAQKHLRASREYAAHLEEIIKWIYDNRGWRFDRSEYGTEVQKIAARRNGGRP